MKHNLLLIALIALIGATAILATPPARADEPNHVALVINVDETIITRCVEFDEPEITGYDVLERSGIPFVASFESGQSAAICEIEDTGCPVESCLLCQAPLYWSYWQLDGIDWVYSQLGASITIVQDGDVEGWTWGNGDDPPPLVTYDDVCAPPATTPPPTTDSPIATPTPPPSTPAAQPTPTATFKLDVNPVQAGECTTVRWESVDAHSVFLDGESVDLTGSQEICPDTDRTLTLRVINDTAEQNYTLILGVVTRAATMTPAATATPPATATPQPTATSQPTATPQPAAATITATPRSTATPMPSPTPPTSPLVTPHRTADEIAFQTQSPLPAPPTPIPPSPTPTIAPVYQTASLPDVTNYLIFGLILGSLLIGLGIRGLRMG